LVGTLLPMSVGGKSSALRRTAPAVGPRRRVQAKALTQPFARQRGHSGIERSGSIWGPHGLPDLRGLSAPARPRTQPSQRDPLERALSGATRVRYPLASP